MGRLIDEDVLIDAVPDLNDFEQEDFGTSDMIHLIEDTPTVEAIPKADYENRLKADLKAMLTDFLMDIEENTSINAANSDEKNGKRLMRTEIIGMFEQKIDKLKEG